MGHISFRGVQLFALDRDGPSSRRSSSAVIDGNLELTLWCCAPRFFRCTAVKLSRVRQLNARLYMVKCRLMGIATQIYDRGVRTFAAALIITGALGAQTNEIRWQHLSSRDGDLPSPGTSREQTGILTGRFDRDSPATDFVMSFRVVGPALVWFRRTPTGWDRYLIEKEFLPLEAGGAA